MVLDASASARGKTKEPVLADPEEIIRPKLSDLVNTRTGISTKPRQPADITFLRGAAGLQHSPCLIKPEGAVSARDTLRFRKSDQFDRITIWEDLTQAALSRPFNDGFQVLNSLFDCGNRNLFSFKHGIHPSIGFTRSNRCNDLTTSMSGEFLNCLSELAFSVCRKRVSAPTLLPKCHFCVYDRAERELAFISFVRAGVVFD